jgi:eukaryotic-like serine/threonine-protein kinase
MSESMNKPAGRPGRPVQTGQPIAALRVPPPQRPAARAFQSSTRSDPNAITQDPVVGVSLTAEDFEVEQEIASVPPPPAMPDPYIGATIDGRYKVEQVLGEGGMGIVYRGRHKVIDKPVAIKVLRADMARDQEITERFLREARAASAIGNPHIIDISDFGTLPDGATYFIMEYLDGVPLTSLLGKEPVPITRLIHIATQIADGLEAAHLREIVHRDLKPDNIFIIDRGSEKDFVKILDFGIAKVSSGTAKLTRHGSVFGTPHYMSPEQAAGAPLDHRTDIYSLGVILYEMTCGKVPFDADNFMGILTQHMYQAPVPIRALVPPQDVPPGLEAIVLKCLSKKPDHRYQSMTELKQDFEKLVKGLVPDAVGEMMSRSGGFNVPADFFKAAMPVPVPATPGSMLRRKPWPLYAGIAGVLAAVAIVVGIFAFGSYSTASTHTAASSAPIASTASAPVVSASAPSSGALAPLTRDVMVVVDPIKAEVSSDDKPLGPSPVNVTIPVGQTVKVVVTLKGYEDETLTLDGSEVRKEVKLKQKGAKPNPAGKTPPPGTGKGHPPGGGSEIVNPWGN